MTAAPAAVFGELAALLDAIGEAARDGDVATLSALVPKEEALLKQADAIALGDMDTEARERLAPLVRDIARRNTKNAILIQGQLALIRTVVHTLFPDGNSFNRLA